MRQQDDVRAFHEKYGFSIGEELLPRSATHRDQIMLGGVTRRLREVSQDLMSCVRNAVDGKVDARIQRMQLMSEELSEMCEAMRDGDYEKLADALGDLQYVVLGTAVTFGMPMDEIHDEVHESNMSKDVDGQHKPKKGAAFTPPNFKEIVARCNPRT